MSESSDERPTGEDTPAAPAATDGDAPDGGSATDVVDAPAVAKESTTAAGAAKMGRILLVEDNPGDARLTIEAFREAGAAGLITAVDDAYEALAMLRQEGRHAGIGQPDLILLDLNLPRMHGREFLAIVKAEPRFMRIPVIVLSTSQAPDDIRSAYDLRANCYIAKPMNLDDLVAVAKHVVHFWLRAARLSPD
jgi:CheY-like chemotaxis protein